MPNIYMHAKFALDVYDKLDINTKYLLLDYKNHLTTFAQSVDPLFLYDLKHKNSRIRDFCHYFHNNKSKDFFKNLINYIKYNHLENDPEIIAFLYGFLSHYILDSTMHPYIIYKTGIFNKNDKDTYKYRGKHYLMENYLDKEFIKLREQTNPVKYKFYDVLNTKEFSKNLNDLIDITFKETFDVNNMSKFYYKSIINMKRLYKLLRYDKTGLKLLCYRFINLIAPKAIKTDIRYISYHYTEKNLKHYLNLERNKWNYPTHKSKKYNYSIIDLYINALTKCKNLILEINKYLFENKKINLDKLLDNLSYASGIDCTNKRELKYFEF